MFGVPGESYLEVLDALHDTPEIRFVICRQEGGAAMMATAWGELTGRPGVAMVTRGPGATNASAGVHIAQQDSVPMVLFVGQIDRGSRERDTFQEVDYRRMFGGMAKWVAEIDDAGRIPGVRPPRLRHGRHGRAARPGRPGAARGHAGRDGHGSRTGAGAVAGRARPLAEAMAELRRLLAAAERPFVILGGGGWSEAGVAALASFLDANDLPAACGFRRQDLLDNDHRCYAGHIGLGPNPKLAERIKASDLVLAIGARLGETTSQGFTLLGVPRPAADASSTSTTTPRSWAGSTRPTWPSLRPRTPSPAPRRRAGAAAAPALGRGDRRGPRRGAGLARARPGSRALQLGEIVAGCGERLPPDAIVTNGAGNYAIWANRHFAYRGLGTQLAPTSGSMGYGLPAAVAAKLRHPDRPVICFAGDGCFLMTGQELATAVQYGCRSSSSWSTTACTARSGCTRSASIRAASRHRPAQPRLRGARAPTAPSARGSRPPRRSRRPSRKAWPPAGRRSCT